MGRNRIEFPFNPSGSNTFTGTVNFSSIVNFTAGGSVTFDGGTTFLSGFSVQGPGTVENFLNGTTLQFQTGTILQMFAGSSFTVQPGATFTFNNIPVFSAGIKLGASTAVLGDYKEGTFTPHLIGSTGAIGAYADTSVGTYRKIGKMVYVNFSITLTNKGSWTGTLLISGLPFSSGAAVGSSGGSLSEFDFLTFVGQLTLQLTQGNSLLAIIANTTGAGASALGYVAGVADNTSISGSIAYPTDT